jgi:hypothetical protein
MTLKFQHNQSGNTLLMVLVGIALLSISTWSVLRIVDHNNRQSISDLETRDIEFFRKTLESILGDKVMCFGTVNNQPRTSGGQAANLAVDMGGLNFLNSPANPPAAKDKFNTAGMQQSVSLGTSYRLVAGGSTLQAGPGVDFPMANIRVLDLYLNNITVVSTLSDMVTHITYQADLMLNAAVLSNLNRSFGPRLVGKLKFEVIKAGPGPWILSGCEGVIPAQTMCENMGCRYTTDINAKQRCNCGFPDLDCNPGWVPGTSKKYIAGYDPATNTPICRSADLNCTTGLFFAGIDESGQPICVALESPPNPPGNKCWCWVGATNGICASTPSNVFFPTTGPNSIPNMATCISYTGENVPGTPGGQGGNCANNCTWHP